MGFDALLENTQILQENLLLKQFVIIFVYALIAKITDLLIDKIFKKIATRTKIKMDDAIISIFHIPICLTIILVGILHAMVIREMQPPWDFALPTIMKSVIIVIWWIAFIRIMNLLINQNVDRLISRGKIGREFFHLTKNIFRVTIVILGFLWLLTVWKIDLTPLFASAGIVGIAVALAAKDTLANFFGGISIFLDNTFKVTDYIIIDSGERGEVVEVGIRSTRMKTRDDVLITIPNSIMANSKIINESAPEPRFRIRVPVGVAYGSDLQQVENIIIETTKKNPNVADDPEPRVRVRKFASSSVDFELLAWVEEPALKGLEIHNLLKAIYDAFDQNDIRIPFPQLDVHFDPEKSKEIVSEPV